MNRSVYHTVTPRNPQPLADFSQSYHNSPERAKKIYIARLMAMGVSEATAIKAYGYFEGGLHA